MMAEKPRRLRDKRAGKKSPEPYLVVAHKTILLPQGSYAVGRKAGDEVGPPAERVCVVAAQAGFDLCYDVRSGRQDETSRLGHCAPSCATSMIADSSPRGG